MKIAIAGFFGGIGQPVTGAIEPLVNADGSQINLPIEHHTGEGYESICRLNELDIDFTDLHHSFPIFKESLIAALGIGTQRMKTAELTDLKNGKNLKKY